MIEGLLTEMERMVPTAKTLTKVAARMFLVQNVVPRVYTNLILVRVSAATIRQIVSKMYSLVHRNRYKNKPKAIKFQNLTLLISYKILVHSSFLFSFSFNFIWNFNLHFFHIFSFAFEEETATNRIANHRKFIGEKTKIVLRK